MSKELFASDFPLADVLVFSHLESQSWWSKLQLVGMLPLHTISLLVKRNVLLIKKNEKTGLPGYVLRDGFMNG